MVWMILIASFVLFSFLPSVYELSRSSTLHPERSFELVHNFPTDFNFYLSRIREGLDGRWTVVERYTSEPHQGSFVHEAYLLMGQLGRFVHVPFYRASDIYHVARVVFGATLLSAIAWWCRRVFAGKEVPALFAFLLAVTASSWPKLVAVVNTSVVSATVDNISSWRLGGYMAWWSVMDSLQRITFIPHLVIGQILMIAVVGLLSAGAAKKSSGNAAFLGILLFVLGMIFPPGFVFVAGVIGVQWVLSGMKKKDVLPYVIVFFIGGVSLYYLMQITSVYPWKRLAEVDIIRPLPFDYLEYVRAVGPILVTGIAGLLVVLFRRDKALYSAVSWVIAWGIFLIVFQFIPQQSPLRFSEMIPHVPLAILSAYVFVTLPKNQMWRRVGVWCAALFILLGTFHMYSSLLWQTDFVDHKIRATLPLVPTGSYVMYPLNDVLSAMWYLYDHAPHDTVIMSETTAGNYIPAVTGQRVYIGHDNTVAFEQKQESVHRFFSGAMSEHEARSLMQAAGSSYVYFGPQEREEAAGRDLSDLYPFMRVIYQNTFVTLYKVTN